MTFTLVNRQRRVRFDLPLLRRMVRAAWSDCALADPGLAEAGAPFIFPPVEATIVSDASIGRVHGQFFNDPSPTDVITFPYGEILLGAETVEVHAAQHGHSPDREAALCLIHGLLHLRGFDDMEPAARQHMWQTQEKILQKVFPSTAPEGASFESKELSLKTPQGRP
jgi:probable rRNA maturation factor